MRDATQSLRVLIANDSEHEREEHAALLRQLRGARIVASTIGSAQLLHGIENLRPDVVVADLVLPGGTELMVQLRECKFNGSLIVTAIRPGPEHKMIAFESGAIAVFDKAREFMWLAELVLSLAERHGNGAVETG